MAITAGEIEAVLSLRDRMTPQLRTALRTLNVFAGSGLKPVIGLAAAAAAGVTALTGTIVALGRRGSDVADVSRSFAEMTVNIAPAGRMLKGLSDAMDGTVTSFELMRTMNTALGRGLKLTEGEFINVAKASRIMADRVGGDAKTSFNEILGAMTRGRVQGLQLRDVQKFVSEETRNMRNEFAASGKEMTRHSTILATQKGILRAIQRELDITGKSAVDFGDRIRQLTTAVIDWFDRLAAVVSNSPAVNAALDAIAKAFSAVFAGSAEASIKAIAALIDDVARAVTAGANKIAELAPKIRAVASEGLALIIRGFQQIAELALVAAAAIVLVWEKTGKLRQEFGNLSKDIESGNVSTRTFLDNAAATATIVSGLIAVLGMYGTKIGAALGITNLWDKAWGAIKTTGGFVIKVITDLVRLALVPLYMWLLKVLPHLLGVERRMIELVPAIDMAVKGFGIATTIIYGVVTAIVGLAVAWAKFKNDWTRAFDVLIPPIGMLRLGIDKLREGWKEYGKVITDLAVIMRGIVLIQFEKLRIILQFISDKVVGVLVTRFNEMKAIILKVKDAVVGLFESLANAANDPNFKFLLAIISLVGRKLDEADESTESFGKNLKDAIDEIADAFRKVERETTQTEAAGASLFERLALGATQVSEDFDRVKANIKSLFEMNLPGDELKKEVGKMLGVAEGDPLFAGLDGMLANLKKQLSETTPEVTETTDAVRDLFRAMAGQDAQLAAKNMIAVLSSLGGKGGVGAGVLKLTLGELQQGMSALGAHIEKLRAKGEAVPTSMMDAWQKLGERLIAVQTDFSGVDSEVGKTALNMVTLGASVESVAAAFGLPIPVMQRSIEHAQYLKERFDEMAVSGRQAAKEATAAIASRINDNFSESFINVLELGREFRDLLRQEIVPEIRLQQIALYEQANAEEEQARQRFKYGHQSVDLYNKEIAAIRKVRDEKERQLFETERLEQEIFFARIDRETKLAQMARSRAAIAGIADDLSEMSRAFSELAEISGGLKGTIKALAEFISLAAIGAKAGQQFGEVWNRVFGEIKDGDKIIKGLFHGGIKKEEIGEFISGITQMATAILSMAAAWAQATDVAGKANRAFRGAFAGLQMGAQIGNAIGGPIGAGIGAAIGGLAGLIGGLLRKPAFEDVMRRVGREWGVQISEELARGIADTAKNLFDGDRLAAEIFHIGDILSEAGGLNDANFDKFVGKLRDVFVMFGEGKFSLEQTQQVLDANFKAFADHVIATGHIASREFAEIVRLNAESGVKAKGVLEFVGSQAARAGVAIAAMFGETAVRGIELSNALKDAERELDALRRSAEPDSDAIAKQEELVNLLRGDLTAAAANARQEFDRLGVLALGAFNGAMKAGLTFTQALQAAGPALDTVTAMMQSFGFEADNAALKALMVANHVAQTAAGGAAAALNEAILALSNFGALNEQTLDALEGQLQTVYTRIQAEVAAMGGDTTDALRQIVPFLDEVIRAHEEYGLTIDDSTQQLIDQAREAGLLGKKTDSATDIMRDGFAAVADAVNRLTDALLGIPSAAQDAADAISRIRPPSGDGFVPPRGDDAVTAPPGERPLEYATGTVGAGGGNWFKNFGSGMMAELHGWEAVIRPDQVLAFVKSALKEADLGAMFKASAGALVQGVGHSFAEAALGASRTASRIFAGHNNQPRTISSAPSGGGWHGRQSPGGGWNDGSSRSIEEILFGAGKIRRALREADEIGTLAASHKVDLSSVRAAMKPEEIKALLKGYMESISQGFKGTQDEFLHQQLQFYTTLKEGDARLKTFFHGDTMTAAGEAGALGRSSNQPVVIWVDGSRMSRAEIVESVRGEAAAIFGSGAARVIVRTIAEQAAHSGR